MAWMRNLAGAGLMVLMLGGCKEMPQSTRDGRPFVLPKKTIVLVHGAWGGGWAFREVDRELTNDGWKVYRPTLTGQGEKVHLASPQVGLSTHIDDVVNEILYEDLHDVVLVGHSYGGMVVTGVADRIPDRIKQVIYLDACLPNDGESLQDVLPKRPGPAAQNGFIYPSWLKPDAPIPHDVPQSEKTFSEKIHLANGPAGSRVKASYVLTVDKGKTPESDSFYTCYQRAQQRGWPVRIMEGDHNVQWSEPRVLVKVLEAEAAR
jgi:pimeloyl-ACP methyl ester carboxylesterase